MKGSIRLLAGLVITAGAAGGLETSTNLFASIVLAAAGLLMMYSGTLALNRNGCK